MKLANKKVFVTGAGGFIGSHLVEELLHLGCEVRALVRYNSRNDWGNLELLPPELKQQIDVRMGDVQDPFFLRKCIEGCQVVFHLAALISVPYSYVAPDSFVNVNIKGTLNLLEASRQQGIERIVHTSTSEVYGSAQYVPIDEKHPLQGQSPYAASKIGADKIVESYYCTFDLPVTTIRPFNTFGPRQSARAVIPALTSQILSNQTTIKVGSLKPIRDFTFVKDTVSAFIQIAETDAALGQVVNVGTGRGVSIGEVVKLLQQVSNRHVQLETDAARLRPEASEVDRLICNNTKARQLLGWSPNYSLEDGLREVVNFIQSFSDLYKVNLYNI